MHVIPVLDLRRGVAVHAVMGQRHRYRTVRGQLGEGEEPVRLAQRMCEVAGTRELYVADLDAIAGKGDNFAIVDALVDAGLHVWLDAGIRDLASMRRASATDVGVLVIGLETAPPPDQLRYLVAHCPTSLAFSVDLMDGRPLGAWKVDSAEEAAEIAIALQFRRLILLDLHRVGSARGPAHLDLGRRLKQRWPQIELIGGGGIRNVTDLQAASKAGFDTFLVGSALHSGALGPAELKLIRS